MNCGLISTLPNQNRYCMDAHDCPHYLDVLRLNNRER